MRMHICMVCVYIHTKVCMSICRIIYTTGKSKGKLCGFCQATRAFFIPKGNTWFVTYSLN